MKYLFLLCVIDIDECFDGSNICLIYVICIDIVGSYICKCFDKGFKGDGYECIGIK